VWEFVPVFLLVSGNFEIIKFVYPWSKRDDVTDIGRQLEVSFKRLLHTGLGGRAPAHFTTYILCFCERRVKILVTCVLVKITVLWVD
jgi:hypothetical protein